jgi:plastocyanin
MNITIMASLTVLVFLGFAFSDSFAITPNNAFTLEGSGYAVTEDVIKTSEIDLAILTQKQTGSSVASSIEDGFITLDDEDFLTTELKATMLREGKYIRINGVIDSDIGNQASISFFGKLIEESKNASIYGFTGRITIDDDNYKIIYTAKLSELSKINTSLTESKTDEKLIIHILKDSTKQGVGSAPGSTNTLKFKHFSQDGISISPKTTITFVNDDTVSHSILSGKLTGDRYEQYIADGRISTGVILPNQSVDITLNDAGFYRLYDPDYPWMDITAYVFPNVQSNVILK